MFFFHSLSHFYFLLIHIRYVQLLSMYWCAAGIYDSYTYIDMQIQCYKSRTHSLWITISAPSTHIYNQSSGKFHTQLNVLQDLYVLCVVHTAQYILFHSKYYCFHSTYRLFVDRFFLSFSSTHGLLCYFVRCNSDDMIQTALLLFR